MLPRKVELPSGATLEVAPAPFAQAWDLYQAILEELKAIPVRQGMDMLGLFKDFLCHGFSSKYVLATMQPCLARCIYRRKGAAEGLKIDADTFEPVECREDYMVVLKEVAWENAYPFGKSLYAEYQRFMAGQKTPESQKPS